MTAVQSQMYIITIRSSICRTWILPRVMTRCGVAIWHNIMCGHVCDATLRRAGRDTGAMARRTIITPCANYSPADGDGSTSILTVKVLFPDLVRQHQPNWFLNILLEIRSDICHKFSFFAKCKTDLPFQCSLVRGKSMFVWPQSCEKL